MRVSLVAWITLQCALYDIACNREVNGVLARTIFVRIYQLYFHIDGKYFTIVSCIIIAAEIALKLIYIHVHTKY